LTKITGSTFPACSNISYWKSKMEERFQVSLSTDGDGYISQQCPTCSRRFKVKTNDQGENSVNFCPYCGSESDNAWLTEEQQAYVMGIAAEKVIDPMLEEFSRELETMNQPGGFITVSGHFERSEKPAPPIESEEPMSVFTAPCCNESVKHDGSSTRFHCVVCGKEFSA
jgi:DNA-directed RNA polymerase subunit RPC12/RpoP